jgi:hypothetical protein
MPVAETIRPEDVLVGLLAEVRLREGDRFRADPVTVHSQFYKWREDPESSDLFREFVFDTRDYFPYSETLDRAFDGLQLAGYLERTNPRGTYYVITPTILKLFEEHIKSRFTADQLKTLEVLAGQFADGIKTEGRAGT